MQRVFLAVFIMLFSSSLAHADEAPVKKWYAGGGYSVGALSGTISYAPVNSYYQSIGYFYTGGSYPQAMAGGRLYAGRRMDESLDLELGVWSTSMDNSSNYQNNVGNTVVSTRTVNASALSFSALLHPAEEYGHMLFFRVGMHFSQLSAKKSVTGTPANLGAIAAGDQLWIDSPSRGLGLLAGIGLDFKTGKVGAVRLEYCHFYRLGGTTYGEDLINVGFHGNF